MKYDKTVEDQRFDSNEHNKDFIDSDVVDIDGLNTEVQQLCERLCTPMHEFEKKSLVSVSTQLRKLTKNGHRILYSQISATIYKFSENSEKDNDFTKVDNMQENIKKVIEYTASKQTDCNDTDSCKCKELAIKILDHINLANYQYLALKQTDEEFKKHFNEHFTKAYEASSKDKLNDFARDMNAQLLTLVGIFTALSFLIFGSLTGLSNMFSNINVPVAKLMILGCIWGIAVLNLVFIFLFCVGKMTKTKFASTGNSDASIWQKYPIVWWSDYILCVIFLGSAWLYYLQNRKGLAVIDNLLASHPGCTLLVGSILIIIFVVLMFWYIKEKTKILK